MQPSEQTTKEFSRWGKPLPTSQGHGTTDDIRQSLTKLKPNSWRMEGNKLIGMTEMGELAQFLPTNYICKGSDDAEMPILVKLDL